MCEAVFDCANKLFGLRFVHCPDIVSYHPDVKTYEVRETVDGVDKLVGIFLHGKIITDDDCRFILTLLWISSSMWSLLFVYCGGQFLVVTHFTKMTSYLHTHYLQTISCVSTSKVGLG